MKKQANAKYLLVATLCVVFPFRLETDNSGKLKLVAPYAQAKSGSGKDGDGSSGRGGGDDGEGDDGESDSDDGEGGNNGGQGGGGSGGGGNDDGEGGDSGESDDSGEDGEGDSSGDDSEGDDFGDDGERDEEKGRDKPRPTKVQKLANGALILFSDGSREEIRDGQFTRTDRNGQVVERRRAHSSDLARMRALFGSQETQTDATPAPTNSRAVKATYRGKNIEILYSNGWREEISSGRYNLIDQYGRAAASRRATQADRKRLNRFRE